MPESNAQARLPVQNELAPPYLIGLDYGTESARAILMRVDSNAVLATAVHKYPHGVIERELNGTPLPRTWALQDADDYLLAAEDIIRRVGEVLPAGATVAGLSVAFTSSTPVPVDAQGEPLSRQHPNEPHAYVKLWKHRAATEHTKRFQKLPGLDHYGGSSSPEWLPSKALELAAEAPALWAETARFLEAGDWLTAQLCGETLSEVRSASHAGYKAHFRGGQYPAEVQDALNGRLGNAQPQPLGTIAGKLSADWQRRTGLPNRPLLAVSSIDAHAAAVGLGLLGDGELTAILGTSACYMLSSTQEYAVPGIAGVVDGGIVPGLYGYEAGQAGFGDVLTWFVRTFPAFPEGSEGQSFEHYNAGAARLNPGEHGLLGLDWFNGCRTPLDRGDLSGLMLGYSTSTTLPDVYRALLESLCFGSRRVLDTFRAAGVKPGRVVLTGGLSERHSLLVQLLSDVLGQALEVSRAEFASARGAVIHAAVACGLCPDHASAASLLADRTTIIVTPNADHHRVYDVLYRAYLSLSDLLASSPVMAQVQNLASSVRATAADLPTKSVARP
jgi:L-ribulokinase